jgi:hypothetical protein
MNIIANQGGRIHKSLLGKHELVVNGKVQNNGKRRGGGNIGRNNDFHM